MKLIGLLVIVIVLALSCASNDLTSEERAEREADRQEKYVMWHNACLDAGLSIAAFFQSGDSPVRCSRRVVVCVPSRWQWNFYYKSEEDIREQHPSKPTWRVTPGNVYQCGRWAF